MPVDAQAEACAWIVLALGLGIFIGLEREYRGFEAGIRTTALVAAGAAVFGIASQELGDSRVAAGIVQGIGFLGAGLIFQSQSQVHNLTTATTVWVAAAVGLLSALELWVAAIATSGMVVLLLEVQPLSKWVYERGDRMTERREQD
jgi:putative Mg2+ transporter-C (MgtC) family protein